MWPVEQASRLYLQRPCTTNPSPPTAGGAFHRSPNLGPMPQVVPTTTFAPPLAQQPPAKKNHQAVKSRVLVNSPRSEGFQPSRLFFL
jgi:hypothetical protein